MDGYSKVGDPKTIILERFAGKVTGASGGLLEVTQYPGGSLGYKGTELLDVMSAGVIEMITPSGGKIAGTEPLMEVFEMPFLVNTPDDAPVALNAVRSHYNKALEKHNAVVLASWAHPTSNITGNKPIPTQADFAGIKIRGVNTAWARSMELMGATPVDVPFPETYTSMATGIIDFVPWGVGSTWDYKIYEVADYMSWWSFSTVSYFLIVKKDSLEALPQDLQAKIFAYAAELEDEMWDWYFTSGIENKKKLEEKGMIFVDVSAAEKAKAVVLMAPVYDEFVAKAGSEGLEALNAMLTALGRPAYK
jgi:TRAP-type C4-dicarboxylate transport system substrate-binding protein